MSDSITRPRLLVTGGSGLLGSELLRTAAPTFEVTATRRVAPARPRAGVSWRSLDLCVPGAATRVVEETRPDVLVHAAVAIAPAVMERVIVDGSEELARAARDTGARMIHVSSDMVFDGESGPFDEESPLSPITDYGRAKAEAERRVRGAMPGATIVRLSLLYRLHPLDRSLAHWLEGTKRGEGYPLFVDEIRCPAHVADVAQALGALAQRLPGPDGAGIPRTLHLVGPSALSRYAFGRAVLQALGLDPELARPGQSSDSKLVRPRRLDLVARTTPDWLTRLLRPPVATRPDPAPLGAGDPGDRS